MLSESWAEDSRFDINAPQVVSDFVDGEVVAVNLETGTYFALYGLSAVVWEALTQGASPGEILDVTAPDPHERASATVDFAEFIDLLLAHHLVRARESNAPRVGMQSLSSQLSALPREPLRVFVHSDLQDILLLDPVHDTSDAGWPEAREHDQRDPDGG